MAFNPVPRSHDVPPAEEPNNWIDPLGGGCSTAGTAGRYAHGADEKRSIACG